MAEATISQSQPTPGGPELAARLREQNAEMARIAGGLAHEIRNPLSTIRMNLDLLAEEFRDAQGPRELRALKKIERVRQESHRLEGLLEAFLRFARVQDLRLERVSLNHVVDELCDFVEPQINGRDIVIRRQFDEDLPEAPLDVDLFKQALFNLVRNAELAMPDGGELIVTTRREGPRTVALELTDTGRGIPPDVLPHIFEPFYSTRPGGTGLGLPTVKKIVDAHQGQVTVESAIGKGTRFTVLLPT